MVILHAGRVDLKSMVGFFAGAFEHTLNIYICMVCGDGGIGRFEGCYAYKYMCATHSTTYITLP